MEGHAHPETADWFAGGDTPYATLWHCMSGDTLWITITVVLDLAVALGYALIALHWWRNQRKLTDTNARRALGNMRDIFIFCGICGYLFIPIKMVWPAWRLYDMFMLVLVYLTWRYAWGARDLKVVYSALARGHEAQQQLEAERSYNKRRNFFLNAISHDLKNPLYGISLQAQVAAGINTSPEVKASLDHIRSACDEASRLLDQFLELGRADRSDSEQRDRPVDLDAQRLLDEIAEPYRTRAAAKGLALHVSPNGSVPLHTDPKHLKRVLTNLIDNAIKFTESGSVKLSVESDDHNVRFHVEDTGPGIAPDQADAIFEEFFQVNNHERQRTQGYGLGLTIAQRLADRLGGTLTVDSRLGEGSRFILAIPARRHVERQ